MIRGLLMIALLAAAHLLVAVPASAQLVDGQPDPPYWLIVDVMVEEDGTSEGTATFGATPGAMDAIADYFSITRDEACRRIAYSGPDGSKPAHLNAAIWEEQSGTAAPGECLYVFTYPPGTLLSVFTVSSIQRVRFLEEFTEPGPRTLFDIDPQGTSWDEEVVKELIAGYGLPAEGPGIAVRITYPHVPDGPETRNADLVEGNTLVWLYSPLGTEFAPDMRGSASPNHTNLTSTSTTTTVSEPFPWVLLLIVAAGAFVAGWIIGEFGSGRRDEAN
ncbi:MAG: hypothetical protein OXD34_09025 [bacterium]|nr:hypothetical protein [bacterium]